jgi:uncharacterized protein
MDLILYHNNCPDGWCAAFIAKMRYQDAELIAMDYGADHAETLKRCEKRDVLMVDFSLPTREENDLLAASTRSFQIYDHHKTAQAVLEGASYAIFDMARSGAGLTWDNLYGEIKLPIYRDGKPTGEVIEAADACPRPWFVNYVEDRDLWNWKLPNSRAICAYLGTLPFTIGAWEDLFGINQEDALVLGEGALANIQHFVRETVKNARQGRLAGYNINILNCTYLNCSEIGNELAKTADFSLTWFERKDDTVQFSLRSIGDRDVSRIAKRFGGGGHKNAAGFELNIRRGRELIDAIVSRAEEKGRDLDKNFGRCV